MAAMILVAPAQAGAAMRSRTNTAAPACAGATTR